MIASTVTERQTPVGAGHRAWPHACDRELGGQGEACLAREAVFAVLRRPGAWIGQPSTTASRAVLPMLRSHSASPSARGRGPRPAGGSTTAAAVREAPPSFGGRLELSYSRFHDGHPSPPQNREWRLCGREDPSIRSWRSRERPTRVMQPARLEAGWKLHQARLVPRRPQSSLPIARIACTRAFDPPQPTPAHAS